MFSTQPPCRPRPMRSSQYIPRCADPATPSSRKTSACPTPCGPHPMRSSRHPPRCADPAIPSSRKISAAHPSRSAPLGLTLLLIGRRVLTEVYILLIATTPAAIVPPKVTDAVMAAGVAGGKTTGARTSATIIVLAKTLLTVTVN